MPVGRDDRQPAHPLVEPAGHVALGWFGREQPVGVQVDRGHRKLLRRELRVLPYRWIRAAPPAATARTWASVAMVVSPG